MRARTKLLLAGCATAIALAVPVSASATTGTFGPTAPGPNLIPDSGNASINPWNFVVSGLPGLTNDVNLALTGVSHQNPPDVDALLVAPNGGGGVVVMSDAGDATAVLDAALTFDDSAATGVPAPVVSGTYKPTNNAGDADTWTAPAGPVGSTLSFVNGYNPNGTWSLYVSDDTAGSLGQIGDAALTVSTNSSGQPPTATNPNAGPKAKKNKKKCKHRHPHRHGKGVGQLKHNHKHKCNGKHHRQPH